ncbi:MAG: ATP-binding protein, partial [Planctomycetaceae bacterium]
EAVSKIANETTRDVVENPALRALRDGVIVGLANHTLLVAKDGTERPIDDSAAPIRIAPNVVIGAVLVFRDISDKKRAEAALRTSEGQLRQLADAMPQMVWAATPDGTIDYYNERWYEFTGLSRDLFGQQNWEAILHPDDVERCNRTYVQRIHDGQPWQIEFRFKDRNTGSYRWYLGRAVPVRDEQEKIVRWFGTCTDIDDTKRSQHTSDFLADASAAVANLDDPDTTLHKVASIAVPTFADWCVVDLYENGERKRVAATHTDPEKVRLAQQLAERYPPRPSDAHGVNRVIRTGQPELVEEIPMSLLEEVAYDAEHARVLRELGLRSYLCVPMQLRGQTKGVLSFVMAESGRRFNASDLRVAQELASRAAVAIENARLYRALQEEDRRKDEFLATLAHELRNPLAPIRTGLQLMSLAKDSIDVVEQTRGMMERQLGQMIHIIDDLLDVSRISRGKLELRKERIELAAVIESALETCDPMLKQSRHQLSVTVPPTPIYLDADQTRLAQVLCNLLSNAVKYTEDGGRISLCVEPQGSEVVVSIRDSGVGIPREMLPKVFEMFTQVDRSLEKSQGGLGIGLTIVKRLVEMHGGNVEAQSEGREMGSVFTVRLPVVPSLHPRLPEPNRDGGPSNTRSCRILVVDDNVDAGNTLTMMLRIMGNEVQTAHDGLQGCELASSFRPHLILMDIGMPRLNGYEACRRIREQPWGQSMKLVALTGWGQNDDKLRSQEAGFDHHLVKPVEPATLCELLSALRA